MEYGWDENKRRTNIAKHKGLDFAEVEDFDWETALVMIDDREDYDEDRYIAIGFIGMRLCVLVFTERGDTVHITSLRKATRNEEKHHAK